MISSSPGYWRGLEWREFNPREIFSSKNFNDATLSLSAAMEITSMIQIITLAKSFCINGENFINFHVIKMVKNYFKKN